MPEPRAFWLDEHFDRERGADGRSRYEAEVLERIDELPWDGSMTCAVTAEPSPC